MRKDSRNRSLLNFGLTLCCCSC
uniref:Uncharacterized protein n=1 Tax=Rhizophora mucronata TaxID=61149 RepID=A0A2P2PTB1_RHIMU